MNAIMAYWAMFLAEPPLPLGDVARRLQMTPTRVLRDVDAFAARVAAVQPEINQAMTQVAARLDTNLDEAAVLLASALAWFVPTSQLLGNGPEIAGTDGKPAAISGC